MSHRQRLPDRRLRVGYDFIHEGIAYTACVGFFPDGRLAEIFLSTTKAGSSSDAIARDAAYVASLALQYGCPLESIRSGLLRARDGASAGVLGRALDLLPPPPASDSIAPQPSPSDVPPARAAAQAIPESETAHAVS